MHDDEEEGGRMNSLTLLRKDHREVKELLKQSEDADTAQKQKLFEQIKSDLQVHETIEEEIFYPALKEHAKTKELALEAYEEHHVVDQIMGELEQLTPDDETWDAKFSVMEENLKHHINEEEREMFEQAQKVFSDEELDQLGEQMLQRKEQLGGA
jgi:hemerythrin-like domain-containing protein